MLKNDLVEETCRLIRAKKPRIHMIPNNITAAFCADIISAMGANPIMSVYKDEFEDVISHANCFVANMGQLTPDKLEIIKLGINISKRNGIPIILDPVGCGASEFRKNGIEEILKINFKGIIKGNYSEITNISEGKKFYSGIDSSIDEPAFSVNDDRRVYVASGETDYIFSKGKVEKIMSEKKLYHNLSGLGCALGAVIGVFYSVMPTEPDKAAYLACYLMKYILENADCEKGYASYKNNIIDMFSVTGR